MSKKTRSFPVILALSMLALASLACLQDLINISDSYNNSATDIPTLFISPTPDCGGNISGQWNGTATGTRGTLQYSLTLTQDGCSVTGTETSVEAGGRTTNGTVSGYVSEGVFHFSETGSDEGACYWTGSLTIVPPGNSMIGNVTNCSTPSISLFKD